MKNITFIGIAVVMAPGSAGGHVPAERAGRPALDHSHPGGLLRAAEA
jgi:hypothetical protein